MCSPWDPPAEGTGDPNPLLLAVTQERPQGWGGSPEAEPSAVGHAGAVDGPGHRSKEAGQDPFPYGHKGHLRKSKGDCCLQQQVGDTGSIDL